GRMSIRGADGIGSTIQRNMDSPSFRIFQVASGGNLTLDWLNLTGGVSDPEQGQGGGAILNRGTVAIHRGVLSNNVASFREGGGAIRNVGTMTITHTEISQNSVFTGSGGGILSSGSLHIEDSFIRSNSVNRGSGGGIALAEGAAFLKRT